jgi:DNA-directed RNA polymerase II subunit RPB2
MSKKDKQHWKMIESYHENYDLTSLQIESFNNFITHSLPDIITEQYINISLNKLQTFVMQFKNVYIDTPSLYDNNRIKKKIYPCDARNRDLSYDTSINCDVEIIILSKKTNTVVSSQTFNKIELFKIPVMVNSCLCNLQTIYIKKNEDLYNNGGYFIIKGKERVLVAQERINYNQIYVYKQKTKYKYIAEIRSIKESADYSVLLQAKIRNDNKLVFTIPYISQDIPIAIIFIAMDLQLSTIMQYIESAV